MRRIARKFWYLSWADRWLLFVTWLLVVAVRVGLWLFPLGRLRQLLARVPEAASPRRSTQKRLQQQVIWSVRAASACVPRATCLTQALVARALLARYGLPALVQIGIARCPDGRFEGHAWVEIDGTIVLGGGELGRYTVLPAVV
jgi:Transglutaminase-like superfamily